tara:strand:+ start:290 stop:973 length:684 start_codon:yes stop_codon:yes gene_type:complete
LRIFDVIFSLIALFFLSPILIIVCLILLSTGEHKIFYFQDRIGLNGNKFKVFKFVTMLENSPNIGTGTITGKNDPRILPVGRVLRKTKINELPQLANVLLGDMSLIGPRPHAARDLEGVSNDLLQEIMRCKPGLSGVGSIFFRNEEEILQTFDDPRPFYDSVVAPFKAELELWYIKNKSIRLYFFLIILTVTSVIFGKSHNQFIRFADFPSLPEELEPYFSDLSRQK